MKVVINHLIKGNGDTRSKAMTIRRELLNKRGWKKLGPEAKDGIRDICVELELAQSSSELNQALADLYEFAELYGLLIE